MSVYIKSLHLISFGKFTNTVIDLNPDFNLIYGANEAGKSTIADFIEGLLYGFDEGVRVRRFNYKRDKYEPVGSYKYTGFGIFSKEGKVYRVSRNFADGSYELYNLSAAEPVETKASDLGFPGKFLLDLDYDLYKVLLAANNKTDSIDNSRSKVVEYLTNANAYNFSATRAMEILDKALADIGSERAYTKPYMKTKNQLKALKEAESELLSLRSSYEKDFISLNTNRDELSKASKQLASLREARDKYRTSPAYKNLEARISYEDRLRQVEAKLKGLDVGKEPLSEQKISPLIFIILAVFLSLLAFLAKRPYLIIVAILLSLVLYLLARLREASVLDKGKDKYNKDERSQLLNERDKLREVLKALEEENRASDYNSLELLKTTDINTIDKDINVLETKLDKLREENLALEKNLAAAVDRLSEFAEISSKISQAEEKLASMGDEISAIKLAQAYLSEIASLNKDLDKGLDKNMSELITTISRGKYKHVSLDADLKPKIETANGVFLDLDKLSTGFYDQLNFALKYNINENTNNNFLIFDDAFITYDSDRLRTALFFLLDMARNRQVIYLSCHEREEAIMLAEGIDFNRLKLEDI